jgi:hypothetical protein
VDRRQRMERQTVTERLIDVKAAPHAHHTAWAYDPDGDNYVLVLENEAGEPIAFAHYSYDKWITAFDNLIAAEDQRRRHDDQG